MILYLKCEKTPSILSVISNKNNGLATLEVAYVLTQSPPNYFVEITISYFIMSVNVFLIHIFICNSKFLYEYRDLKEIQKSCCYIKLFVVF